MIWDQKVETLSTSIANELWSCEEIGELNQLNVEGDGTRTALRDGGVRWPDGGTSGGEISTMAEVWTDGV